MCLLAYSDEQIKEVVQQALEEAGATHRGELTLPDFQKSLRRADLSAMKVSTSPWELLARSMPGQFLSQHVESVDGRLTSCPIP